MSKRTYEEGFAEGYEAGFLAGRQASEAPSSASSGPSWEQVDLDPSLRSLYSLPGDHDTAMVIKQGGEILTILETWNSSEE